MPHRFVVLRMLENYQATEESKLDLELREKLIRDIKNGNVEFVYSCNDTSAGSVLREHSVNQKDFSTYFLISLIVPEGSSKKIMLVSVAEHLNSQKNGLILDSRPNFQVITY